MTEREPSHPSSERRSPVPKTPDDGYPFRATWDRATHGLCPVCEQNNACDPNDPYLYAIQIPSGDLEWKKTIRSDFTVVATPVVAGDIVITASMGGRVTAIDRQTGDERWRRSFSNDGSVGVRATPAVSIAQRIVVVATDNGAVHALDLSTGVSRWNSTAATGAEIWSSPVIATDTILVGSDNGAVYALALSDGTELWAYQTGGKVRASVAVSDGVVYVVSWDDHLYALVQA